MTHEPPCTPHEDDDTFNIDIESNIGWEPPEAKKYRKLAEEYRRSDKTIWPWNSMVESRPANEWRKGADGETPVKKREPADLFGTLWREGELAVLAGAAGVGKSILAVQIAEAIARGRRVEPFRPTVSTKNQKPKTKSQNREVLYFDLEHTAEQFTQRYSVGEGRRRRKYDFSPRNIRSGMRVEFDPPEAFRGNLIEYLFYSIEAEIRHKGVSVVIIDSLAHLAPNAARLSAAMRTLRLWCAQSRYSILAIAGTRAPLPARSRVPITLTNIPPQIAQYADSVFSISPSTMREDVRYLKHLKSTSTPITLDDRSVAMYYLGRMDAVGTRASLPASTSATDPTEITESANFLISSSSPLVPHPSSLLSPFLGLSFVAFTPESDHLRNYAAEAQAELDAQTKRLKRIKGPRSTIEMLMSPEYGRYLKGE